jgi:SSS family transporter
VNWIDWLVIFISIGFIVGYGAWKTRKVASSGDFHRGTNTSWLTVGLSVMATQASAITFLSAPGLGYESGLRFVQFYFGLPIAVWFISRFFIDEYYKSRVITAYEYLERKFDLKIRLFTAFLFLIQRGLAAGITIYAPAIVLCVLFGWDLVTTCVVVGLAVIVYTVSGGTRAVSITGKWQMAVIFLSLFVVTGILIYSISGTASLKLFLEAAHLNGKLQLLDWSFDPSTRYTVWSGLLGGFFLSLSYFGTDQSQVQRYLSGSNVRVARKGLYFNGLLKIPMQLFILFIGVLVWMFFSFADAPMVFNPSLRNQIQLQNHPELRRLENQYSELKNQLKDYVKNNSAQPEAIASLSAAIASVKQEYLEQYAFLSDTKPPKDTNFIFLHYVVHYLPHGLIGLVVVMVVSAAMSSTAGELNALATTTMIDYLDRLGIIGPNSKYHLLCSRVVTFFWGLLAIAFAIIASLFDNLIEMVNILGSLFYGTILGIFLVAFFVKKTSAPFLLLTASVAQMGILGLHFLQHKFPGLTVEYLWYNLLASLFVFLSNLFFSVLNRKSSIFE